MRQPNLHRISSDTELTPLGCEIVSLVLNFHQTRQEIFSRNHQPWLQEKKHLFVIFWGAQSVDARNTRHHDYILSGEQTGGCRKAQPFDLLVDGGVFFNIGVGSGDVGLRLVVVEITHEVLHRVVRKESFKFTIKLRRQGFVMTHHQSG